MPLEPSTKDDLLDLWRRILPREYTVPIEQERGGQGFDVPSAQAAIYARMSEAVNNTFEALFLKDYVHRTGDYSRGEQKARVDVELSRLPPAWGDIVVPQGTRLLALFVGTRGQRVEIGEFRTAEQATIPDGSLGPVTVEAVAELAGSWGNVREGTVVEYIALGSASLTALVQTADTLLKPPPAPSDPPTDNFLVSQVGQYVRIIGLPTGPTFPRRITDFVAPNGVKIDPPLSAADVGSIVAVEVEEWAELGLQANNPAPATGGRTGHLDAIARDRRQARIPNETDDELRLRLCYLDDIVSPAAVLRTCDRILSPLGIAFRLKETRDVNTLKGFVLDLDALDFGQVPPIPKVPGSELVGDGAVLLSVAEAWTFFLVCVAYGNQGEFGAPYDALNALPVGNAWDVLFLDGAPLVYNAAIGRLWEALDQARAAGVGFDVARDPTL